MQIIEKNTRVRLKIVGTRVDATEIVSKCYTYTLTYLHLSFDAVRYWDDQGRSSRRDRLNLTTSENLVHSFLCANLVWI